MIQVCEAPAVQQTVRRLSAEEFCLLSRGEAGSLYRPHSEVLRMLTVGEAWGVCGPRSQPESGLLVLPVNADAAAAAALRELVGWNAASRGCLLLPPVGRPADPPALLLHGALERAVRLAHGGPVWAVLECTADAEELVPLYLSQGLALRAIRPLSSLAPCYLFVRLPAAQRAEPVWVPLADIARVAMLLARGWAAVDSRATAQGTALALCPV